jgi:osmoprotectant transport system permease protein
MSTIGDVVSWFADGDNWQGRSGVPTRLVEHLRYSVSAVVGAAVVTMPVAAWLGHKRRFGLLAVNVANIGQTLPSFAVLVLLVQLLAFRELPFAGPLALFLAMALLAIPPLFVNTYTGVAQVDDALRDSARGMGMTSLQRLLRVELPVAAPVLVTGLRIAFVQVIATATLGAYLGVGGLGRYIIDGYAVRDYARVFAGAVLVAALALLADQVLAFLQRRLPGARQRASARASMRPIA